MTGDAKGWYSVRCVFQWNSWEGAPFGERTTLWQAESLQAAIALAEAEATEYGADNGGAYLHLAQGYALGSDTAPTQGSEVFSLLRDSGLTAADHLDARHYLTPGSPGSPWLAYPARPTAPSARAMTPPGRSAAGRRELLQPTGQVVVPDGFLADTGMDLGDTITLTDNGFSTKVTAVGEVSPSTTPSSRQQDTVRCRR